MDTPNNDIIEPVSYARPNGEDIVGDKKYINSIRDEQSRDIIDNCRVGNYDNQGNYVIDAQIVKELIGMNKYISRKSYDKVLKENTGDIEFKLIGNIPLFGEIEFRVVVTKTDAKLFLIEEIFREGGGYLEVYGEQLSEYASNHIEREDIKTIFSIFNVKISDDGDDDFGKKIDEDQNVEKLLIRKIYLSLLSKKIIEETAVEEKETFERIVEILKTEGGEYGKRVLKNFIDRLERRPEVMTIKDRSGYNKALNDMLVGSIEVVTTDKDLKDEKIKGVFDKIAVVRNENTQNNIETVKKTITVLAIKEIYDKIKGPNKPSASLETISKSISDVDKTLAKSDLPNQPKPVLKQETRSAILKQGVKNVVISEEQKSLDAAAVKKEQAQAAQQKTTTKTAQKQQESKGAKKTSGSKSTSAVKKSKSKSVKKATEPATITFGEEPGVTHNKKSSPILTPTRQSTRVEKTITGQADKNTQTRAEVVVKEGQAEKNIPRTLSRGFLGKHYTSDSIGNPGLNVDNVFETTDGANLGNTPQTPEREVREGGVTHTGVAGILSVVDDEGQQDNFSLIYDEGKQDNVSLIYDEGKQDNVSLIDDDVLGQEFVSANNEDRPTVSLYGQSENSGSTTLLESNDNPRETSVFSTQQQDL